MDNKFGICCGCPAIMNDSRNFTIWEPYHSYHLKLKEFIKADNDTSLKNTIIDKPELVYNFNDITTLNSLCDSEKIKFNIDSTDYHNIFDKRYQNFINDEIDSTVPYGGKEFSSK